MSLLLLESEEAESLGILIPSGALAAAGAVVAVLGAGAIATPVGAIVLAGPAPTLVANVPVTITPPAVTLALAGLAPTRTLSVGSTTVAMPVGAMAVAGPAASANDDPPPPDPDSESVTGLRVFSEVDLNDSVSYYGGYKWPRVLEWKAIQRGLSDHTGQIQHLQFGAVLSDVDYFFRGLLNDPLRKYLTNRPTTIRIIDDVERRLEETPMIIANGFLGDYSPLDNLRFEVKGHDWLRKRFTRRAKSNESWQPRITLQDFPNANGTIQTDEGGLDYSNAGMVIPIIYGRITDTNYSDPGDPGFNNPDVLSDQGDGQFVPIYVGDYVLAGETWRGALVAAHACNEIEAAFVFHDPVDLSTDPDWLTPNNVAAWYAAGFDPNFNTAITINGNDYCMIFIKGYAGDLFVGKEPIPEIRRGKFGNVPIAINVWGRCDNGESSGNLITNGFDQYLDFLTNYVTAEPTWTSGVPAEIPFFPTMPTLQLIDAVSFTTARQFAELRVGGGYELNFAIGVGNEAVSIMDVIAEFNVNLDCEQYFNAKGQFSITMEPEDDSTSLDAIDDVTGITDGTFEVVDQVTQNFWNVLPFRHTYDYTGRMQQQFRTEWRSEMTGDLERRHESSIANYEQERPSSVYEFKFIRGRNRLSDSPYYDQGSATVEDIMMRLVARYADPKRIVTLGTAFNGLQYECGDIFPVTTVEGIGAAGWVGRMVRVINHTVYPSRGQVLLECYDLRTVIEAREELTTSTGGSPFGSPEYEPPIVGSPGSP